MNVRDLDVELHLIALLYYYITSHYICITFTITYEGSLRCTARCRRQIKFMYKYRSVVFGSFSQFSILMLCWTRWMQIFMYIYKRALVLIFVMKVVQNRVGKSITCPRHRQIHSKNGHAIETAFRNGKSTLPHPSHSIPSHHSIPLYS